MNLSKTLLAEREFVEKTLGGVVICHRCQSTLETYSDNCTATQLTPLPPRPEEHEVIEVHWLPFTDVLRMADSGELRDGKSCVGVYRAAAHMRDAK
jgi:hypothetical protein